MKLKQKIWIQVAGRAMLGFDWDKNTQMSCSTENEQLAPENHRPVFRDENVTFRECRIVMAIQPTPP